MQNQKSLQSQNLQIDLNIKTQDKIHMNKSNNLKT